VRRSADNAAALESAIIGFGFGSLGISAKDFQEPGVVVQLGRPPFRIDLLTSIDGVDFDKAWEEKQGGFLDDVPVWFIGRENLIANKRASGRPQDLADVQKLAENENPA
jgi:hypothetical protein